MKKTYVTLSLHLALICALSLGMMSCSGDGGSDSSATNHRLPVEMEAPLTSAASLEIQDQRAQVKTVKAPKMTLL